MECARRRGGMRNWSSSPTTAGTWVRRASRSGTLTRGVAPAAWPPSLGSEEPPAWLDRGLALSVWLATYFGGRILNIPVPHTGHTPFSAGRPFAIFTCCGFEILRLRSEEHTSELQSLAYLVCRLLLEKKKEIKS